MAQCTVNTAPRQGPWGDASGEEELYWHIRTDRQRRGKTALLQQTHTHAFTRLHPAPLRDPPRMTSYVEADKLQPTAFEGEYLDQYDYYSLTDRYSLPGGATRKGRTKKEASDNTNRFNPGGHERKITEKLQNSEKKKQGPKE